MLSRFYFPLDDVPTRRKVFYRSTVAAGSIGPFLVGRLSDQGRGAIQCGRLWDVAQKTAGAILGTTPPRVTRFLKTSVVDRGSNCYRTKPVPPADSTWCPLPWQIVGSVRRTALLSGFSLRNKSTKFCAKARGVAGLGHMMQSKEF